MYTVYCRGMLILRLIRVVKDVVEQDLLKLVTPWAQAAYIKGLKGLSAGKRLLLKDEHTWGLLTGSNVPHPLAQNLTPVTSSSCFKSVT